MVGLVLVSHSRPLATAVRELVRAMTGPALPLAVAAGAGENHAELGTDAVEISEAILSVQDPDGVLVLMDMGSAILSAETALDLLEEKDRANIRFCAAPFVEGAVAAGVTANLGSPLEEVHAEAMAALRQKESSLQGGNLAGPTSVPETASRAGSGNGRQILRLTVRNTHGLHARPAARLITETRPFSATITIRNLSNQRGPASVKSLSGLASLEILQDHEIEVLAEGSDAAAALKRIGELVEEGFGEAVPSGGSPASTTPVPSPPRNAEAFPISDGLAIGPLFYLRGAAFEIPHTSTEDVNAETERLKKAVAATEVTLEQRRVEMTSRVGAPHAAIYEAQLLALQDPELTGHAIELIFRDRKNAAWAWDEANREIVKRYASLNDPYLRERATDIVDVGQQVLERLGLRPSANAGPATPSIIVADDLTPRQVSSLDKDRALGVILLDGGPTAHSSILLRALGFPAVIQARSVLRDQDLHRPDLIAFDGATGKIWTDPSPALADDLRARQEEQHARKREEQKASAEPGATLDGQRIQIFANIGNVEDAAAAAQSGTEGVGLLRTEFLFLNRETPPTEDEQFQALRAMAEAIGNKPIIVRTLDVGGDKEVAYLHLAREANPFLGVRALRLCLQHEDLFATQLRAILRAGGGRDFKIMFPMVADLSDLQRARASLGKVHAALEKEAVSHLWPIDVGIMIEIPSAALLAESLAEHADFFSIGTNDLTQYTLAADRGNPDLGPYQDALHPAVLRLIDHVVRGAQKHSRLVAVCGEAASDEIAALVLAGLGIGELSVSAVAIPRIKATLRAQKMTALRQIATEALKCQTAGEVRQLVRKACPVL
jgi:phosphoenolpyruvate-protein phosphotransferase/dihydroxyacetone kinase phosphotransfer subunit